MRHSSTIVRIISSTCMLLTAAGINTESTEASIVVQPVAYVGGVTQGVQGEATFSSIESGTFPVMNNAGDIAFMGTAFQLDPTPQLLTGLWIERDNQQELIAFNNQRAPGTDDGISFKRISPPQLDAAGHVSFWASVMGPGVTLDNNLGIWADTGTGLGLIAREGMQAPGEAEGVQIYQFQLGGHRTNTIGQTMFSAFITGPSIEPGTIKTWIHEAGTLTQHRAETDPPLHTLFVELGPELVVQDGDLAPGISPPVELMISPIDRLVTNRAGQRLFFAFLAEPGTGTSSTTSVWLEDDAGSRLIARQGDPAPGTEPGVLFNVLGNSNSLNTHGDIALQSSLVGNGVHGENNQGIWIDKDGVLELAVRSGTEAPGAGSGANFFRFEAMGLNDRGAVAFGAKLYGGGIDESNDRGIWLYDHGSLDLIVREGDQLEVAPGDLRTVSSFLFDPTNEDNGATSGFNDQSQLVFRIGFTDGTSGVFMATPEPGSAVLSIIGTGILLLIRHNKS